jgi:uncharacterized damage-inducible protein DinB
MLCDTLRMLARYNTWANRRVYDAVAALPEAEVRKARDCAFFGSIHGTLNHLLVVDRSWFARIEETPRGTESLGQILHDDFAALRAGREAEDAHMTEVVDALDEAALRREVSYSFQVGEAASSPLHIILITLFNHQTHHRGQVHAMLKEAGADPPPLDIIDFLD